MRLSMCVSMIIHAFPESKADNYRSESFGERWRLRRYETETETETSSARQFGSRKLMAEVVTIIF